MSASCEIYEHVNDIKNNITITWIPSHVGIKGNEMADRIAQHAITNENVQLDIGLELKEINYCIFQYIDEKWQHIWTTSATGQFYRKSSPSFIEILNMLKIELRKTAMDISSASSHGRVSHTVDSVIPCIA